MSADMDRLREELEALGLDLVAPFAIAEARALLCHSAPGEGPLGERGGTGLVVGHSRAWWPRFLDVLRRDPVLADRPHPIDEWTSRELGALRERVAEVGLRLELRFAHEVTPALPIQALAELAGLATLGPAHLSVHPRLGPWISLRAVILTELPFDPGWRRASPDPCRGCEAPCRAALDSVLAEGAPRHPRDVAARWRAWVTVRDACPVGRAARYDEVQLEYHYRQDRALLARAVAAAPEATQPAHRSSSRSGAPPSEPRELTRDRRRAPPDC